MLSSLLNYRLYTDNLAKTLERVGSDGTVAREAKYYKDNIGKVSTVDDLLKDQRLYAYALKAYGLEDQIASKAFIRKVLESDLTDSGSFANKLVDGRYRTFAAAFDFRTATAAKTVQSANQTDILVGAYSEHGVRAAVSAAAKTSHFEAKIATITSVDDLLADDAMVDVVARTAGLDPAFLSRSALRDALVGAVTDDAGTTADDALFALTKQFAFAADGSVATAAQSSAQTSDFIYRYNKATGNAASPQAAAHEAAYFESRIGQITAAADLVSDERLFSFALTAYGFDPTVETPAYVQNVLESEPGDPASTLAQMSTATSANIARKELFTALNAAFGFSRAGTTLPAGEAQDAAGTKATVDGYYKNYQTKAARQDALATNAFRIQLSNMKSLNDLLANDPVYGRRSLRYVLTAFDLDPATESSAKIRKVLQSDASDPSSYVNRLKDERYEKLAAAFNFGPDGKARAERLVQSISGQQATATFYAASFGTNRTEAQKAVVKGETQAYLKSVGSLRTLDDLLADTKTVNFALKAYGLDEAGYDGAALRNILTSDLADPASFARKGGQKAVNFAAAFNFTKDGLVSVGGAGVQNANALYTTQNQYLLQTLEAQAGETSEGTRLALYFLRKAPEIKSAYSILADKAMYQVVRTALGLPDSLAQIDIAAQAKIISKRLDVKDFSDARKLDKFIARFTALYDRDNTNASSSSPGLQVLGGGGSSAGGGVLGLF